MSANSVKNKKKSELKKHIDFSAELLVCMATDIVIIAIYTGSSRLLHKYIIANCVLTGVPYLISLALEVLLSIVLLTIVLQHVFFTVCKMLASTSFNNVLVPFLAIIVKKIRCKKENPKQALESIPEANSN